MNTLQHLEARIMYQVPVNVALQNIGIIGVVECAEVGIDIYCLGSTRVRRRESGNIG